MKILTLTLAVMLSACFTKGGAVADTTHSTPGVSHRVTAKAEPDTLFDDKGNFCVVRSKPHFDATNIDDLKADTFCLWQKRAS